MDPLESVAILYCIFIASIRTNWLLFIATLKIGIIGLLHIQLIIVPNVFNKRYLVVLVSLGWYLIYNLEDFKNMIILIMRKNSIEGENNHETDFENALIGNFVSEKENCSELEIPKEKTMIDVETENKVVEAISNIDINLDKWIPQIDKFIENFNADTKIYIEYVDQGNEIDASETSNLSDQFSSEQLVSELERITDNLVRDTRKIADNVCMVSSMIVENLTTDSLKDYNYEKSASSVATENSNISIKAENIGTNSDMLISETKPEVDIVSALLDSNSASVHQEWEIEDEAQLICNTENIAESMVTAITSFVETLTQ